MIYGGDGEAVAFSVDARELRNALHARGAVLELQSAASRRRSCSRTRSTIRCAARPTHVDFLRVDLKKKIGAIVAIELVGGDDAPGIKEGGILDQPTREVNVEALPTDIPESIQIDVSGALDRRQHRARRGDGAGRRRAARRPRDGRRLDARPRASSSRSEEGDEIEEETGVVGEGEAAEGEAATRPPTATTPRRRVATPGRSCAVPSARGAGRLADRRARQPGLRVRAHAAQRRLPGVAELAQPLGPAEAEEEVRRAAERGPHRRRRAARRGAPAADLHERVGQQRRARRAARSSSTSTTCSSCTTRSTCRSATSVSGWAAGSPATTA